MSKQSNFFRARFSKLLVTLIASCCLLTAASPNSAQESDVRPTTSFESETPGAFSSLRSKIGVWVASDGKVAIDDKHGKTGTKCMHLAGGERTVLELQIATGLDTAGEMRFWAERWTKQAPFSFRIEKKSGGTRTEIHNGDESTKAGRAFLSRVRIRLDDPNIERLRFSVTSPQNSGVLIDDLTFAKLEPQRVIEVKQVPMMLPVLAGTPASPLSKINIRTTGVKDPISVNSIGFWTDAAKIKNLKSLRVYYGGDQSDFSSSNQFGEHKNPADTTELPPAENHNTRSEQDSAIHQALEAENQQKFFQFKGAQVLSEGDNYFWLACTLPGELNIDNKIQSRLADGTSGVQLSSSIQPKRTDASFSMQRLGVAVRQAGDDGIHTFRIPGLVTTNDGTLIGVYDIRRDKGRDLPGNVDVGMSRSTDGGQTWQPMKVIMDMGDDPEFNFDGIGDPSILVDRKTGSIWVAATWSHGNRSWVGSGPGLEPTETGQLMLTRSDDDGLSWSAPINITKQVKKPEWSFLLEGPGKGITMSDGTIVFPAQFQAPANATNKVANRLPFSTIIFSRDHGATWKIGTGAWDDTTESQVIELADGELMLNCRYNRESKRVVMTSKDMGANWLEHPTSRQALVEPRSCMGSLINVGRELTQRKLTALLSDEKANKAIAANNFLLFSNPDSINGRNHITIKASLDGGLSWPAKRHLLLDEQTGAGYSCMTMIDEQTVGIFYECSQAHMAFQRIKLNEILRPPAGQKTKNPKLMFEQRKRKPPSANRNRSGDLKIARTFGSSMVLQADRPIPIWGTTTPNDRVTISFAGKLTETTSDSAGHWAVELPSESYNWAPQILEVINNQNRIAFSDVLVGEVWLCAGQSNMEWPLSKSTGGKQAVERSSDQQTRLLNFAGAARGGAGVYKAEQLDRLRPDVFSDGMWRVCDPRSSAEFSAVGYYFAEKMRAELKCPIGIINVSIGGTPIESWIQANELGDHIELREMLDGNWLDNPNLDTWCRQRARSNLKSGLAGEYQMSGDQFGPNHSFKPGFMFDAGVRPFTTEKSAMAIRGVLWYQGESNADSLQRIKQHDAAFSLLVNSWRRAFRNPTMPIAYVQLPAMGREFWPSFRESQRRSFEELDHVGMAVTIDTGHPTNVHPADKQPAGQRLAQWALTRIHGQPGPAMGPMFLDKKTDGKRLLASFKFVEQGILTLDGLPPNNFELAGADGIFHSAEARIVENQVSIFSNQVTAPIHVRYAWSAYPAKKPNLCGLTGIPASPFTTQIDY